MHYRLWSALAISAAIVAAAAIFGSAWSAGRAKSEVIAVTGLAQQDFVSDLIVWRASFGRQGATVAEAYAQLRSDAQQVQNFLVQRGIPQSEIVISAVAIAPEYKEVQVGDRVETVFDGYKLTQNVSVESKRVDKVEQLSREISQLIDAGIILNSQQPQYYYTKLAELKLDLLSKASKDGTDRAAKIAENANGSLGRLLRADMGIFQITGQNSDEEYSWGGTFNTSSKRKTASITVKMEFGL